MWKSFTSRKPSALTLKPSTQPSGIPRRLGSTAIAFAVLAASTLDTASLSAQQTKPTHQPGHRVALIDVAYLLKNLPAIKAHVSKVKADLRKEALELKQRRDALRQAVERLKTLKIGSPEYARQEEYVADLDAQLRLPRDHRTRERNEAEAKLYRDSYRQIVTAIQTVATDHRIHLVLNFDSQEMDVEQSDSVFRGVMRHVIYYDGAIDLTQTVMRHLEKQPAAAQSATSDRTSANASSRF